MPLRCVYVDLDGTLLGLGGSLFRDATGGFTLLPARGLEACHRAGVEVVLMSGRRQEQVHEDARLIGQSSYIYEIGCGIVIDGEETLVVGDLHVDEGQTVHDAIEAAGAPALLLERFAGRFEYHSPWHTGRTISHLFRGVIDLEEANALLEQEGLGALRLLDNGVLSPKESLAHLSDLPRAYHLIPRAGSKGGAVAAHMRARGYAREECIAVGDSREDLGAAEHVGRFFLVRNAVVRDEGIEAAAAPYGNVEVTEEMVGEGFYEAVVRTLAESK